MADQWLTSATDQWLSSPTDQRLSSAIEQHIPYKRYPVEADLFLAVSGINRSIIRDILHKQIR